MLHTKKNCFVPKMREDRHFESRYVPLKDKACYSKYPFLLTRNAIDYVYVIIWITYVQIYIFFEK